MDNDFKRQTPRPFGQPQRPLQPSVPRPVNGLRPMPIQPRPHNMQQPMKPTPGPSHVAQPSMISPISQSQPTPAQNPSLTPSHATFTPASPVQKPIATLTQPAISSSQPEPLSFEPPKKKKTAGRLKKIVSTVLPIAIIVAAIIGGLLYFGNIQKKVSDQAKQIMTLESQLRSAQQTNLDLNRQIATLPGLTIGLTQAEQNNVTAAISSGNYASVKPFLIENTLVILAASEGIGYRSPENAVKELNYFKSATQPWNFSLDSETLDNYRDGDYAQYFPEGAIIGKSADGKVISLTTTTTGRISVIFMAPDESLL